MPRLTQAERNRAIGMADMGASQRQIARTFNCSQAASSSLLSRYQLVGQAHDRPRSGRPRDNLSAEPIRDGNSTGTPHQQMNSDRTTPQGWYQSFPPLPWNGLDRSTPSMPITMGTNCTSMAAA